MKPSLKLHGLINPNHHSLAKIVEESVAHGDLPSSANFWMTSRRAALTRSRSVPLQQRGILCIWYELIWLGLGYFEDKQIIMTFSSWHYIINHIIISYSFKVWGNREPLGNEIKMKSYEMNWRKVHRHSTMPQILQDPLVGTILDGGASELEGVEVSNHALNSLKSCLDCSSSLSSLSSWSSSSPKLPGLERLHDCK